MATALSQKLSCLIPGVQSSALNLPVMVVKEGLPMTVPS
jgi:hypothetical protein